MTAGWRKISFLLGLQFLRDYSCSSMWHYSHEHICIINGFREKGDLNDIEGVREDPLLWIRVYHTKQFLLNTI